MSDDTKKEKKAKLVKYTNQSDKEVMIADFPANHEAAKAAGWKKKGK